MLVFEDFGFRIHKITLGSLKTNCFIIQTPGFSFVLDPVGQSDVILSYLDQHKIRPEFCLATHAHFDHIAAASDLIEKGASACLYFHENDLPEFERANTYSLLFEKRKIQLPSKTNKIDSVLIEKLRTAGLNIMNLPGHTKGSCILYSDNKKVLFTGDTILNNLIALSVPRITENTKTLKTAIEYIEQNFAHDTLIFPGHGKLTTLGVELAFNKAIRFLKGKTEKDS